MWLSWREFSAVEQDKIRNGCVLNRILRSQWKVIDCMEFQNHARLLRLYNIHSVMVT